MNLTEGLTANISPPEPKDVIRGEIERQVGDDKSLLGTLSDVSGALLASLAIRVICLADHASNEAQRQELEMLKAVSGDVDIVASCRAFLAKIEAGTVVLTASIKGVDGVLAEAAERGTKTAAVLAASQQSENNSEGQEEVSNA